jgi:hypothetical protein
MAGVQITQERLSAATRASAMSVGELARSRVHKSIPGLVRHDSF